MNLKDNRTIYTIGHSTRSKEEFLAILLSFGIEILADVRHYPGSRNFPQFNRDTLRAFLHEQGIAYLWLMELGGRRKSKPDSANTIWRNEAFRGYADYMETGEFNEGISRLTESAMLKPTAYMCAEAVWWRCHRALISDHLKADGWKVMHLMKQNSAIEHPFTSAYRASHPEL
jgi:uncharacterized protein (DUF488 family)